MPTSPIFRVVPLRRQGKRLDRSLLESEKGVVGRVELSLMTMPDGASERVFTLMGVDLVAGVYPVHGQLHEPVFETFNGRSFLVKGVQRLDAGNEFIQEWWGRLENEMAGRPTGPKSD